MSELKLQQCRLDGRYDILDCLGRGSYSEVYVARDGAAVDGSPHTVVIKALNTHLQGVPDAELERTLIENFRNEAVALDRVRHPNIISRLGHGTAIDLQGRTFHYLVLEYLSGGDLQALCRQHPRTLEGTLFYLEQVCRGLAHAHRHGVIHRDIKPQNLLLTADQHTVKIADFGVAKIEAAEGAITRVGTDVYAAPEHHPLRQTGPLDTASLTNRVVHLTPAADIYSLAKTTFMLLTGEAPRGFSQKPITVWPPEVATEPWVPFVGRVLERATQTNPEKRHQTVGEFWDDLKDAALPRTRLLKKTDNGTGTLDDSPARRDEAVAPMPPAPVFERRTEPSPSKSGAHQRIVVPLGFKEPPQRVSVVREAESGPHNSRPPAVQPTVGQYPAPKDSRLSPRLRNWLVALFLLVAFAAMLYATHVYMTKGRPGANTPRTTTGNPPPSIGGEFITTTDVKLRSGPGRNNGEVGLAEKGSTLKILGVSGVWYKVDVIEHGRPKEVPDSADQGWAHSSLMKAK
ncbi:MAG TPA: protein kinase [Pyrinomonadaceae bacterium]|jgi:serine/threonine-protein kinase|nr:protein kinase [Pyrinomonadaceae bacterium]